MIIKLLLLLLLPALWLLWRRHKLLDRAAIYASLVMLGYLLALLLTLTLHFEPIKHWPWFGYLIMVLLLLPFSSYLLIIYTTLSLKMPNPVLKRVEALGLGISALLLLCVKGLLSWG
jgi:hypothetical protein